ncbi:MAG: hypothetical protein CMJ90_18430 [Planctomycetes bacterium]|jgi:hypothetical protein|nr:hypothetical protein [Planctomycetota bacterium]HCV03047.1 hypothetical protein [Pseudoalteromonas sp.]|tara:strand:+ start:68229 stop:68429 length:201 start_codon:yes stop_codon:yes gene_type:complete
MLVIQQLPTLKDIFWDWRANTIDEKDAFEIIEKRWPYIAQENLTADETTLINRLKDEYGFGVLMVA